jgi:poly(hydroxyalkanoate) depolymerase family esterase
MLFRENGESEVLVGVRAIKTVAILEREHFWMNDQMQAAMAEATRLTRAGRLKEATALIQRTLGGVSAPGEKITPATEPDQAGVRIVEVTPTLSEPTIRGETEATSSSQSGGKFVDGKYNNTAGTRSYKLYIPSNYNGQAIPLLIMLHGCTQNAIDFAAGSRMNIFAEQKTFLVAYPEQNSSANSSKCWNWFQPVNQRRGMGEPSLIAGITRQIMNSYHVDINRVYMCGMSAGGAMAVIMAVTCPDLYAAVGVHSGLSYGAANDVRSGMKAMKQGPGQSIQKLATVIPLISFHGDRDTTVSSVNTDHLLNQWLQATNLEQDKSAHDTEVKQGQAVGGRAYTRSIYYKADGQVIAEKWLIHQAGHVWSGGSSDGSFTDPRGPDASSEMLRFFAEHSRER